MGGGGQGAIPPCLAPWIIMVLGPGVGGVLLLRVKVVHSGTFGSGFGGFGAPSCSVIANSASV